MAAPHPPNTPVRKRAVFYIPGYDPVHPRRYRELYRTESAKQAEISGYDISLTGRQGGARYGWDVKGLVDGADVDTSVDVLVWSDIVRDSMDTSILATYLQLLRTAWVYISCGALWQLMRLRKGPVIAALYPVGMLLGQLLIALALCAATVSVGKTALVPLLGLGGHMIAVVAGIGVGIFALRWFKAKDGKFFAYYLMHDYAYGTATLGAYSPELTARMKEFEAAIVEAFQSDVDEVLIVGHSSGAHLGVSVLNALFADGSLHADGPAVGFLTLGQVVPMVSFLPKAFRLRSDLRQLSRRDDIMWVDVTAPGDGCAFALCDPVAVSGVAPPDKRGPLVLSAAFSQTLSPERWKELRWRFFRLHFQYMCAFDRPGDYDYFQITAGPKTLRVRFRDRQPSKSRIETPVNKNTGVGQ